MDRRQRAAVEALAQYRAGRINRRRLARLLGGLGLTAAGGAALARDRGAGAQAGAPGGHYGHNLHALMQEGTPPPVATPVLGARPDGTAVWRVQVAALDPVDLIEAMGFFPGEITINAGDAIFFDFGMRFHTVTFTSGQEYPRFGIPDEAAGTPAATGGVPKLILNPITVFPAGGGSYDGAGYANSGVPLDPAAPPFVLTFTTPGSYEYQCLVHPMAMKGTVIVQEHGAAYPYDQAAYDQIGADQAAALLDEGRALIAQHDAVTSAIGAGGATVWEVTVGVGGEHVEAYWMLPKELTIKTGDTVRWTNRSMHDPHTVTFLGGAEPPEFLLVEPQAGGPPTLVLNSVHVEPAGGSVYSGQGVAQSGYLGRELAEFYEGFPRKGELTYELTFDTPGAYRYYCVFHSGGPDDPQGMVGTITVEAS